MRLDDDAALLDSADADEATPPRAAAPSPSATDPASSTSADPTTPSARADAAASARVSGAVTARTSLREGAGNDAHSARVGLEWSVARWSGGLTAEAKAPGETGAALTWGGRASLAVPERWVGWKRQRAEALVAARLGHSFGLRFAEGLVLDAPSFDGLHVAVERRRVRAQALAGRTEALDPIEFKDEPFGLFDPDEEDLGDDGRLAGARVEVDPTKRSTLGASVIHAALAGGPSASLASLDLRATKGWVDLSAELARRNGGGTALWIRSLVTPNDAVSIAVERRSAWGFLTPVGNVPTYSGLSPGGTDVEDGWFVGVDFAPTERFSGSVSFDWSDGSDRGSKRAVVRDHRAALTWGLTERTSLSWGFELEDVAHGRDGRTHSLLATHAFEGGARLAGRLAVDAVSDDTRTTLRLGLRQPFASGRIALVVDETVRHERGSAKQSLALGASFRVADGTLTVRGTLEDAGAEGLDLTWYSRF